MYVNFHVTSRNKINVSLPPRLCSVCGVKYNVTVIMQFEKTADHLFDAAFRGQKDAITGMYRRSLRSSNVSGLIES